MIAETKAEFGIELTEDQVVDIIIAQSNGLRHGLEAKRDVKLDGIGKMKIKEGREMALETAREANEMGLEGEERKQYFEDMKLIYLQKKRKNKKLGDVTQKVECQLEKLVVVGSIPTAPTIDGINL